MNTIASYSNITRCEDVNVRSTTGFLSNEVKQKNIKCVLLMRNVYDILFTYKFVVFIFDGIHKHAYTHNLHDKLCDYKFVFCGHTHTHTKKQ